jgi:hypothetical protein
LFSLALDFLWVKFPETWREGGLDDDPIFHALKKIVEFVLESE